MQLRLIAVQLWPVAGQPRPIAAQQLRIAGRRLVARQLAVPIAVPLPSNRDDALAELVSLSEVMVGEGRVLIQRILPEPPATFTQWEHYPKGDAIDPVTKARWFYHAHPPEQRGPKEHGHFHLFLPLSAFDGVEPLAKPTKKKPAKVVHVAALCFDTDGLPTHWIATNQWVTDEYLYPAEAIIARLGQMDMSDAGTAKGIPLVGRWLTCALAVAQRDVEALLHARDAKLATVDPQDRDAEILASAPFRV